MRSRAGDRGARERPPRSSQRPERAEEEISRSSRVRSRRGESPGSSRESRGASRVRSRDLFGLRSPLAARGLFSKLLEALRETRDRARGLLLGRASRVRARDLEEQRPEAELTLELEASSESSEISELSRGLLLGRSEPGLEQEIGELGERPIGLELGLGSRISRSSISSIDDGRWRGKFECSLKFECPLKFQNLTDPLINATLNSRGDI